MLVPVRRFVLGFSTVADDEESDSGEESDSVPKRSARVRQPKQVFTYHEVGGKPIMEPNNGY